MSAVGQSGDRIGVMLVNLGTPDAPDAPAVRRYLRQFLSDRRVVEIPPLLWQPLLRGVILPFRASRSAEAYRAIWTPQGSPLAVNTMAQRDALQARLGDDAIVRYAMCYGQPAVADVLAEMRAAGCDRILFAPLYPQYCAATTAAATDALFDALKRLRWQPAIRTLPPYADDPAYIAALAASVRAALAPLDPAPDALLVSFHGMPERTRDLGDPYDGQCRRTAALLEQALDMPLTLAFQSRFGRAKWLEPATDAELERLARSGVRHIAVIAPGFAADCIETLEELGLRGREQFLEAGGERLTYIPALNASPTGIDMLETLVRRELAGWVKG